MADGSSGGLSGVLFEAGQAVTDAGKQAAQKTAATVFQQTGVKNPFGSSQAAPKGSPQNVPPNPLSKMGGLDAGGNNPLEKLFGGKSPLDQLNQQQPNQTQQQLDQTAAHNKAEDNEKIARLQQELRALHDKVYYDKIRQGGNLDRDRQRLADEKQAEDDARREAQAANQQDAPVKPGEFGSNLGTPVNQQPQPANRNFEGSKPTG